MKKWWGVSRGFMVPWASSRISPSFGCVMCATTGYVLHNILMQSDINHLVDYILHTVLLLLPATIPLDFQQLNVKTALLFLVFLPNIR